MNFKLEELRGEALKDKELGFEKFRSKIQEGLRRHVQAIGGLEKAEILEIAPGHVKLAIEVSPECLNLYGNAHGGFLFSLCDMAAGMSTYAYEILNVTQSGNIQFLRGVSAGRICVESNAVHKGRKTVVNQVQITDEQNRLIATATMTMFLGDAV